MKNFSSDSQPPVLNPDPPGRQCLPLNHGAQSGEIKEMAYVLTIHTKEFHVMLIKV